MKTVALGLALFTAAIVVAVLLLGVWAIINDKDEKKSSPCETSKKR
jgi:hypothetical protein